MKIKHIIILFIIGWIISIFAGALKILHISIGSLSGNTFIGLGTTLKIIALLLAVYKILMSKNIKSLLEE